MNRNMIIVLAGGFLIAVLVAVVVQAGLSSKQKEVAVEPPARIAVAMRDLPAGTTLAETDLKWQDWPKAQLFAGAVVQVGDKTPLQMVSGTTRRQIGAGEPIQGTALVKSGQGNFVAALLAKGMRAVGIDVNAAHMAGGFIGPGDYVDVILTYQKNVKLDNNDDPRVAEMLKRNLDRYATETILQNVRVLAVDQAAQRTDDKGTGEGVVGKTVTVEVDRKGAERLALAGEIGTLSLSLRKLGDDTVDNTVNPTETDERMTHITREIYDQTHKITGDGNNIVRVYNGYNVEQSTLNQ